VNKVVTPLGLRITFARSGWAALSLYISWRPRNASGGTRGTV